jgi:hypothetical protein
MKTNKDIDRGIDKCIDNKREDKFLEDLHKLQDKYPECFIDAYMASDYVWCSNKELTKGMCIRISELLYDSVNAHEGTNWNKIHRIISNLIKE